MRSVGWSLFWSLAWSVGHSPGQSFHRSRSPSHGHSHGRSLGRSKKITSSLEKSPRHSIFSLTKSTTSPKILAFTNKPLNYNSISKLPYQITLLSTLIIIFMNIPYHFITKKFIFHTFPHIFTNSRPISLPFEYIIHHTHLSLPC